jgi:hypothetical protein
MITLASLRHPLILGAALTAAFLGLAGCYTYTPTPLDSTGAGEAVRLYVSESAQDALSELAPDGRAAEGEGRFRGTIVAREADRFLFQLPVAIQEQGAFRSEFGQNVWISTTDVMLVERRDLDPVRTGLMVGLTAAGVAAFIHFITVDAIRPATPSPGDGEGGDESRMPLLQLRLP